MNLLSVSTYSVREQLGPVVFDYGDADGNDVHIDLPYPKLLSLSDFPKRAHGDFGVDAIETVAFQFDGLEDPDLDRFAGALSTAGVQLVNVAIDAGNLLEADVSKRAADVALIKRWIERFAAMGSQFVRVNPGSPFSPHHGEEPPAYLVAALRELGAFSAEHGARLLVENHGGPSSDPAWMNSLLWSTGRDSCGLLLDLGNFDVLLGAAMALGFSGEQIDPGQLFASLDLEPLYAGIEALADRAELVHVKVHDVAADGTVGAVDLPRALGILDAHGYSGPLTVEYEGSGGDPWTKCARVLDVVRARGEFHAEAIDTPANTSQEEN